MADTSKAGTHLKAFLILLAILASVHLPVVFGGRTLSPAMLQPHGLLDGAPYGYTERFPAPTFNVDLPTAAWYEWPINRTIGKIYLRGELPLWNPYQAAGTPLAADYSTRAFFPYQIMEDISPPILWDLFLLGRPLVAGFFTYLFLAALGLSFPAALLGGVLYMLSGVFTWFINLEQMANVAMSLPILMHSLELLVRGRGRRHVAYTGVATALVILGGQPEVALYALLFGACYFIFRLSGLYRRDFVSAAWAFSLGCAALALGLALSSPLTLPFLEFVDLSYNRHPGGAGVGTQFVANWMKFFGVLTPAATALPADPAALPGVLARGGEGFFYRIFATKGSWDYLGGYTGVVGPYLALSGLIIVLSGVKVRFRGAFIFFAAFAAAVILKNFGLRPFLWLGELPMFDLVWSPRWAGPAWVFSASAAGAVGVELIARFGGETGTDSFAGKRGLRGRPLLVAFIVFIVLFAAFPLASSVWATVNKAAFGGLTAPYVTPAILISSIMAVVLLVSALFIATGYKRWGYGGYAISVLAALELWWCVPRGYDHGWLYLKLIPMSLGLVGLALAFRGWKRPAAVFFSAFLFSFMWVDFSSSHGLSSRHNTFTEPPYVGFLKERGGEGASPGGFRIVGGYGVLIPNYAGALGLHDVRYINAMMLPSYRDVRFARLTTPVVGAELEASSLWFTGLPWHIVIRHDERVGAYFSTAKRGLEEDIKENLPWYSIMGVRYVLMPKWFEGVGFGLPLVYDREVKIFENPGSLPRAFVIYPDEGTASLVDYFSGEGRGAFTASNVVEYGANRVTVEASAEGEGGLLVLTDVNYPGWEVTVDGKAGKIYIIDGVFRGVFLAPGDHILEFRFRPGSFTKGAYLFIAGAAAVVALLVPFRRRRRMF